MDILIYTKNDIKELYYKIANVVNIDLEDRQVISKDSANLTTKTGTITIRRLTEGCRGYRKNIILYDGKFTAEEKERMRWNLLPNGLFKKLSINSLKSK